MRFVVLAMLVGCTSSEPTVLDASCTSANAKQLSANADLEATLDENETVITEITFDSFQTVTASTTEQWACGEWTVYVADIGPIGCTRDHGQPATQQIAMAHQETLVDGVLPDPLRVSVSGKLLGGAVTSTVTTTCP